MNNASFIIIYFSFLNKHPFLSALGFLIILIIIYKYIPELKTYMYYLYIYVSITVIIPFLLQFVFRSNKIMQYVFNIILFILNTYFLYRLY
jgi:hypothetical protein